MHMIDMASETEVAFGISATLSGVTPAKGNIVDLTDFGAATFCYQTGAVTDAGGAAGFAVEIQESDTTADADFTAVADADLAGGDEADLTVTADDDDSKAIGRLGYIGNKRYVRVVVTGTTGTDAVVNGVWALQGARYEPTDGAADNIAAT
jgi:hypothetical protein